MEDSCKMKLLSSQYKNAIDARDRLNDNYYKWMSYYYVANAGVLVAITSLFDKSNTTNGILILSLIGFFICILWNLSCKGYYYWSKSWIEIIISYEKKLIEGNIDLAVYSIFSGNVAKNEDSSWKPNKPANISTPKITLLFSFASIVGWLSFSIYEFLDNFDDCSNSIKIVTIVFGVLLSIVLYGVLLPKWAKSRGENSHTLV